MMTTSFRSYGVSNVGTPLQGSPVTFAVGPKEYLAVQGSGRHVHPIKYDSLETSSYRSYLR